jgi:hypothetical protein
MMPLSPSCSPPYVGARSPVENPGRGAASRPGSPRGHRAILKGASQSVEEASAPVTCASQMCRKRGGRGQEVAHAPLFRIRHRARGRAPPPGVGTRVALAHAQRRAMTWSSWARGGMALPPPITSARNHGITNVAVIEKGWLGGGNTGRNTTIIRSNYLQDPSAAIYEKARSLYETLSQDLNYNIMFSPRGVMMLAQTEHEIRGYQRTAHANALQGVSRRSSSGLRSRSSARSSTSRARATRSSARSGSRAAARRATTRSPGAMRGRARTWGWTSSSRPR